MRRSRAAAAAGILGAASAAAWWRWRSAHAALRSPIGTTSRVGRNVGLARLGARAGIGELTHRARRAVTPIDQRDGLDEAHAMRTAEQVAATLGNMRGALMKLGQMASYLDEGLPEHLRVALSQLQQAAPPMSAELAAGVIRSELGADPSTLFAEWDPDPIAAASIGQVHRARLHDGRAVAVKVQYPGVDEAIRADLATAGVLFKGMSALYPGLDPGPLVAELQERLLEELDYRIEADNQELFAAWFAEHPFISVPGVVREHSTARVLTSDFVEGSRFDDVLTWSQEQRDLAGEAIFRFVFRGIYRLHAFNGDPHPGNYLFHGDGRVTFLDFGLVKRFDPAETEMFGAMIRANVAGDGAGFRRAVERAGLLPPGQPFPDEDIVGYFSAFYHLVAESKTVRVEGTYASELVRRTFDASGPYGPIMKVANVPKPFVIIQRINLGLIAVLAHLGATANWRLIAEELWPWVAGPPSTPMGELEAAWLAQHHPDVSAELLA